MINYYEILCVKENATQSEIRVARDKIAKLIHPDSNKCNPICNELQQKLNAAYDALSKPQKRSEYDFSLRNYKNLNNSYSQTADLFLRIRQKEIIISELKTQLNATTKKHDNILSELKNTNEKYHGLVSEMDSYISECQQLKSQLSVADKKFKSFRYWSMLLVIILFIFLVISFKYSLTISKKISLQSDSVESQAEPQFFKESFDSLKNKHLELSNSYHFIKQNLQKIYQSKPFIIDRVDFKKSIRSNKFDDIFYQKDIEDLQIRLKIVSLLEKKRKIKVSVKVFAEDGKLIRNHKDSSTGYSFSDEVELTPSNEYLYLKMPNVGKEYLYRIGTNSLYFYADGQKVGVGKLEIY